MKITDFLFGKITILVPTPTYHKVVFDILRQSGANYENMALHGQDLVFSAPKRDAMQLEEIFRQRQIPFEETKQQGLYLFFHHTARRPGLYLGFIFMMIMLLFSTRFVFDIRISGNEILTDHEVLAQLEREGFTSGSYLPKIDMDALCNRLVLHSDTISWISVNMLGTVAHVEIKERQSKPPAVPDHTLSCLVATRDGVIVGFDCTTGKIAVSVGETVRAGQVLVNGVTDTALGTYYGNAAGAVRARTEHVITVKIPKKESLIVGNQRIAYEKSIIFLGKTIKVFTKGGNLPPSCDTMKTETKQLSLHPSLLLPIHLQTTYLETPIQKVVTHSEEEAYRLANEEYNRQIAEIPDLQILQAETMWSEDEEGYTLTRKLSCIENIAKKVPIETN